MSGAAAPEVQVEGEGEPKKKSPLIKIIIMVVAVLVLIEAKGVNLKNTGAAGGLFFSAAEIGGVLGPLTKPCKSSMAKPRATVMVRPPKMMVMALLPKMMVMALLPRTMAMAVKQVPRHQQRN